VVQGGWLILFEPELHLGQDVLVLDLAGWRRERMLEMPDTVGFTVPPDWVCEVLSPSTTVLDRGRKMAVYARESERHVWLVDRAEPFEALGLELGVLWAH
jgi:Uma2 family endonuclease